MFAKIIRFLVSVLMLISPSLPHMIDLPAIPSGQDLNLEERFELTWSDEFDGTELDRTKWQTEWWVTERKGGYWHEDMVSVKDGNLIITTAYFDEPLENRYYEQWKDEINFKEYKPGWYTACISSQDRFTQTYGYYEIRCILPKSTGMWSAFWMMNGGVVNVDGSGQDGTEVDIFESMYYKDEWLGYGDCIISGIVYDGYGPETQNASIDKWYANNPYEEYNTYGLEWNENEYIFYINGVETGRITAGGVSQNPEWLLVSCEVAGENGVAHADRHGTGKMSMEPGDTAEFIVDYVRVYQYK
ncbi:MAG: glycoside hydrolase family 16 protein [Clostridia bacterium]|nr:glycoside hydrolase family 16 protein [Clostridia bacterium]